MVVVSRFSSMVSVKRDSAIPFDSVMQQQTREGRRRRPGAAASARTAAAAKTGELRLVDFRSFKRSVIDSVCV